MASDRGVNQRPRRAPHPAPPAGFTLVELMVVVAIVSVLAAAAIRSVPYAIDLARLSSTEASLRVVSDALLRAEAVAPLPTGFFKVADLESRIGPYVSQLPTVDAWGNDLYYELIRDTLHRDPDTSSNFRVYSYGKDGIPDANAVIGRWMDFDSDVVIEVGLFVQTKW